MAERPPEANGEEDGGVEGGLLHRRSRLYAVNQKLFGGGSGFVALAHDGRLESILSEAFACMEHQVRPSCITARKSTGKPGRKVCPLLSSTQRSPDSRLDPRMALSEGSMSAS